jgi:hypothetical protein
MPYDPPSQKNSKPPPVSNQTPAQDAFEPDYRDFSLHDLTGPQQSTIDAFEEIQTFDLLPTHCINTEGELEGFHASYSSSACAKNLPINRTMFHGHSVFECLSEERIYNTDMHRLSHDIQKTQALVSGFLRQIADNSVKKAATLTCMPDYEDETDTRAGIARAISDRAVSKSKFMDSKPWVPELPRSIGVYHAYIRGHHQRTHRLFIVVSGGLERCGNEYYNLVTDVAHTSTMQEIVDCQETWWLRKANQRARARLAYLLAFTLDLKVQTLPDNHDFNHSLIASPVTETLEFDIRNSRRNTVSYYNAAIDTTSIQNGIVCHMHPGEGVWIFRGEQRSSTKSLAFGSLFGNYAQCGLFPTRCPSYIQGYGYPNTQVSYDNDSIVRLASPPVSRSGTPPCVWQHFDEPVKKNFENMGWNRENGIVELVPIIVGLP